MPEDTPTVSPQQESTPPPPPVETPLAEPAPAPAPAPAAFLEEKGGEEDVGASTRGKAASDTMVAVSKAARCFLLYDPENEAIRHFLIEVRKSIYSFLEKHGELVLSIRPWEMLLQDEVVYLNRDRERSLSFRLFRDGVRHLTIRPEVEWEEITQLLSILSIRFTGIRQQEDDIVTLLWKAGFKNIEVEAVEGFVPEDDEPQGDLGAAPAGKAVAAPITIASQFIEAPYRFDHPWPVIHARAAVSHRPIEADLLRPLQDEDTSQSLPTQCVRLVGEILRIAADPSEPMRIDEAQPLVEEIRDFLLSEGLVQSVLDIVRVISEAPCKKGDEDKKEIILRAFTDSRALGRIIHTVPPNTREVPGELHELMNLIPGDKLIVLMDILARERSEASRRVTRQLIAEQGARRIPFLISALRQADSTVIVDLLQVLSDIDMVKATEVAIEFCSRPDVSVQLAAIKVLEDAFYDPKLGYALVQQLEAPNEEVRLRALKILADHKERNAFHAVMSRIASRRDFEAREAEALGTAMSRIWPERALHQYKSWLSPKGILAKVMPGQGMFRWAIAAGLTMILDPEAENLLRTIAKSGSEDLHRYCMQCLIRRRRIMESADVG